ncbi:Uma2 family endonuclease [Pannus brasiliensis CCIBt3594]|uniref:Uma2 family endonuclease n=1 Tax=Pannus brasiliensis CCIBt3594 TaxID=1427578 RepID=A0AAW9QUH3_9CHRO
MQTAPRNLTLEAFLQLPETRPASEFIHGKIYQKAMPRGEHSRLQYKFCSTVNQIAEPAKIACAFPELRCIFGGHAIVPDVAVFRWEGIPRDASGRVANRFESAPDWSIEILSPDRSLTKVLENLLLCSRYGTELGWLINPIEEIILAIFPEQRIEIFRGETSLPILPGIEIELTVDRVFAWLQI